jgi:peptidoglycan/LPS O-acetylase OafA/YrhL
MFGTFRFVLAMMVVHSHYTGGGLTGPVAVFGFFCLSGHLMTRIVNETYSDGLSGYLRYIGNRALRIYPAYYVAAAFAAGVLLLWPVAAQTAAGWYMFPEGWLHSITIIGLQPRSPILVVPAWSLHVELIYYVLIGAILGRFRLLTVLWFVFALATPVVVLLLRGFSFEWLYFSPYGSSIAFATGAMIYQFREKLPAISPILAIIACCVLIFLGLKMSVSFAGAGGMHLSIIVTAVAIVGLKDTATRRWDSALGDLAYPVFLMHIPCRAAMYGLLGRSNVWIDLAAIATTIALSCLIVALVERPLSVIRAKLRSPESAASRWIMAWRQS